MWRAFRRWLEDWGLLEPQEPQGLIEGLIMHEEVEKALDLCLGPIPSKSQRHDELGPINLRPYRHEVSVEEQAQRRDKVLEMGFTPCRGKRQRKRKWLRGIFNRLY